MVALKCYCYTFSVVRGGESEVKDLKGFRASAANFQLYQMELRNRPWTSSHAFKPQLISVLGHSKPHTPAQCIISLTATVFSTQTTSPFTSSPVCLRNRFKIPTAARSVFPRLSYLLSSSILCPRARNNNQSTS